MRNKIYLFGYKINLKVGLKLFFAALLMIVASALSKPLAFTLMVLAGLMLSFPTSFKHRANRLCEGDQDDDDEDEVAAVLEKVKKQTEKILKTRGFISKEAMEQELEKRMATIKDITLDEAKELKEWLGEGDKGIRSILKKQGEEIAALKESGDGKKKFKGIRAMISEKMKDIEKVFKSGEGELKFNVRAAAVMTLGNTIEGDDLLPDELIESFSINAFVPKRQAREYVFDIANRRTVPAITQFKTWLEEGDEEGGFAIVAEGGLKPLVSTNLVRNYSEYKKIAAKYIVTEEFAKFRKEAYSIIQRLISMKLTRDYAGILTTDLRADAAPYVSSALDGQYLNPTDYHAIGAVAAQIEALDFMPDTLILNPQDKWRIGLSQDQQGQFYLTIPMVDPQGNTRMMGFTVRTSNKLAPGEFILGEGGLWEIEDEPITIRVGHGVTVTGGTSNGGGNVTDVQSDIDHNRFRVIVETFFHNYIASANQGSFVLAQFDTVKELLTAP